MKNFCVLSMTLSLCGCTLLPLDERQGAATIQTFKKAIQCEVAAVATEKRYEHFRLPKWFVKTSLDMTLIDTYSGDARASVLLINPILASLTPSGSLSGKFTHSGHVDFAISVPEAISAYGESCQGPDPSQTHLGLAAWVAATLDEIPPEHHGGLSYTVNVDVVANVGSRFGFIFSVVNTVDSGGSLSREGVHHLVVTMAEPTPPPPPLPVRVVGPVSVIETKPDKQADHEAGEKKAGRAAPAEAEPGEHRRRTRHPALEDPNLNRMLQQQAPVRLAPGTTLR